MKSKTISKAVQNLLVQSILQYVIEFANSFRSNMNSSHANMSTNRNNYENKEGDNKGGSATWTTWRSLIKLEDASSFDVFRDNYQLSDLNVKCVCGSREEIKVVTQTERCPCRPWNVWVQRSRENTLLHLLKGLFWPIRVSINGIRELSESWMHFETMNFVVTSIKWLRLKRFHAVGNTDVLLCLG